MMDLHRPPQMSRITDFATLKSRVQQDEPQNLIDSIFKLTLPKIPLKGS